MTDDRDTIRSVAWREVFPGLHLFSALRMALSFRALVLSAIALVATSAGWRLFGYLFSGTSDPHFQNQIELNSHWPWEFHTLAAPTAGQLLTPSDWDDTSPLLIAWRELSAPFIHVFTSEATFSQTVYWLLCALWALAFWAFIGGVITRTAAVSFARQENLAWGKAAGFAQSRWGAYFAAPLFPVLGAFLVAAFLAVLGLLLRPHPDAAGGAGLLATGVLWPLALFGGFVMAFLLIGLFFGWPLMWGAISSEGTDSFGALSHALSYTYQRPLQYLMYAVAAAGIGLLGWYLVALFAVLILELTAWGVSWGSGGPRLADALMYGATQSEVNSAGAVGAALIHFWNNCVRMLAGAFVFSYFWSASTVIYFLLRRLVDGTELDEVYLPEEQGLHGLPPLKTGPDGMPEAADDPAGLAGAVTSDDPTQS